ncbi:hypothetical protein BKA62DRAFT_691354 [Auriculariales sp. MPI-PUGE-AT-0066]|nr:hypothetical protein BKA62DRAFT_691354 [Auriculariales sp. MPI-PUGE-AT-0066]
MSGTSSPTAVMNDDDALSRAGLSRALASAAILSRGAALALGTAPRTASLLGTQLNASDGDSDIDPRVYLNPSLPWTAVVLGQQGSGHSHSACAVLESCIIPDARTSTNHKSMAALVCTYDQLDVGQPSKLVSVAVSDAGEKVTVLSSPRRLKHMRKVYSSFKHVSVLPLSLRTSDISPAIFLQLFEHEPHRLQRWVKSKYLKAGEALTFASLSKDAHNELPANLHESFVAATDSLEDMIQEESPSVTLHFESGRLLVADLSDPYISASSVAIVSAILAHAFACWNASRDKIVVLENADAYLPTSEVLQRELNALTQRTAALNLRMLISAHNPSPSFTRLMRNATFVLAHQHADSGADASPLCPGEAHLYSPGAVVLDAEGEPGLLGARSLVVSVRARLTGPAIHVPLLEVTSMMDLTSPVIPPPPTSFSSASSSVSASSTSMPDLSMSHASRMGHDGDFYYTPSSPSDITSVSSSSITSASLKKPVQGSEMPQPPSKQQPPSKHEPPRNDVKTQPPSAPSSMPPTSRPLTDSSQRSSAERSSRNPAPSATQPSQSRSQMIWTPPQPTAGSRRDRQQQHRVTMEELEEEPEFRLAQALDSAAAHILEQVASRRATPQHHNSALPNNLVQTIVSKPQRPPIGVHAQTMPIAPSLGSLERAYHSTPSNRPISSMPNNGALVAPPKRFSELLNTLETFSAHGESRPSRADVAAAVGDGFLGTGFVTFRGYALAAEKAGLVRRGGSASAGTEWLELAQ